MNSTITNRLNQRISKLNIDMRDETILDIKGKAKAEPGTAYFSGQDKDSNASLLK